MTSPRTIGRVLVFVLTTIIGCGDDGPSGPSGSLIPAPVDDLAVAGVTDSTVMLTWTAPHEIGKIGAIVSYDVRYGPDSVTVESWGSAAQAAGEPIPSDPDSTETFTVAGLQPETRYWFALRSTNENARISEISNSVRAQTDSTRILTPVPATVTDLAVASVGDSTVILTWAAPGEITKLGAITSYDVRYGPDSLTQENWAAATTVAGEPAPAPPESPETLEVGGLEPGTKYWFALQSMNDLAETSGISNSVAAKTDSIDDRLIAYYPLIDDSIDVTGHYGPIRLVNAPFENGGVACNGVYFLGGVPGAYDVQTPSLTSLDFQAFTIRCRFRVTEVVSPRNWVIVGSWRYRWMGCVLYNDTTLALSYNNNTIVRSDIKYQVGTWHELTLLYDGVADRGELYLDGAFVVSRSFVIEHGDQRDLTTNNGASAEAFKGTFGGLRVYDGIVRP
jgi:hypothetical protein